MGKKKPNEIREEMRKQMSAKYKQEVERLKELAKNRAKAYLEATNRIAKLEDENSKLKEKLSAQQDWIERLMEFVDMPEEHRHEAVQKYVNERKMSEDFHALFHPYFECLNRLNLL